MKLWEILGLIVVVAVAYCIFVVSLAPTPQHTQQSVHTQHAVSATGTSIQGPPTISSDFINAILCKYSSPECRQGGQIIYQEGIRSGIDPVFALAFFWHESSFGTQGVARYSKSLGNLRCIQSARCIGGYAYFDTFADGVRAWYALLKSDLYIGCGLDTIESIIPRYAPAADNNDEQAYIQAVESAVSLWRSGQVSIP